MFKGVYSYLSSFGSSGFSKAEPYNINLSLLLTLLEAVVLPLLLICDVLTISLKLYQTGKIPPIPSIDSS